MAPIIQRDGKASNETDSHISFIGASIAGGIIIGFLVSSALFRLFAKVDAKLRWQLENAKKACEDSEEALGAVRAEKAALEAEAANNVQDHRNAEREKSELMGKLNGALRDRATLEVARTDIEQELRRARETHERESQAARSRLEETQGQAKDRSETIKQKDKRIAGLEAELVAKITALETASRKLHATIQMIAEEDERRRGQ